MIKRKTIKLNKRGKSKFKGEADRPRIAVYRSNRYIYAQAIDDSKRRTLVSVSEQEIADKKESSGKKEKAFLIGRKMAEKMKKISLKKAIFDRRKYKYHGRVAALANGLREGGIII